MIHFIASTGEPVALRIIQFLCFKDKTSFYMIQFIFMYLFFGGKGRGVNINLTNLSSSGDLVCIHQTFALFCASGWIKLLPTVGFLLVSSLPCSDVFHNLSSSMSLVVTVANNQDISLLMIFIVHARADWKNSKFVVVSISLDATVCIYVFRGDLFKRKVTLTLMCFQVHQVLEISTQINWPRREPTDHYPSQITRFILCTCLYVCYVCVCVYNPFCFLCSRNRISKSKFRLVHIV